MPQQVSNTSYRALRVLLIEDSAVLRDVLLEYLKDFPYVASVDWADAETPALRMVRERSYDVVIVDLQLRQGNGINVLRAMQRAGIPGKRVVYTNHAHSDLYRRQCAEAGADHFLDKSLELEQVFRVLQEYAGDGS